MKKQGTVKLKTVAHDKGKIVPLSVSPSAWQTWEKCALSLQSVKSSFALERDEYAMKGTELHKAIEQTLKGESVSLADSDDAALVRFAVESTLRELNGNKDFNVELPLYGRVKNVNFSGTADCIATNGDTVTVIDFKTGWREVEAEGNSQLKLYAHIKAATDENIKWWKGVIINARFNSVSYAYGEIDTYYLSTVAADITARTAKKQHQTGNHCAYCSRLSTCAKIRMDLAKWVKPGMIDGITREPERLAEALRLAKPAEKLFETVKKEAQLFLDLGGIIPGVSIEHTAGIRTWPSDLDARTVAGMIGLDYRAMLDTKVISPAQAEKIGASKDAINAIAIRPPRKGFKFI